MQEGTAALEEKGHPILDYDQRLVNYQTHFIAAVVD